MRNFEQVPEKLAFDTKLSVGARATYPILRHLAWRSGRRSDGDAVELPPVEEIAGILGCAVSTAKTYVAELRAVGWIETRRGARNRPALYVIHDEPQAESVVGNPAHATDSAGRYSDHGRADIQTTGAALTVGSSSDRDRRTSNEVAVAPKVVRVNGRDLAFDALAEVTGTREKSPRLRYVAIALNAPGGKPEDGIRAQFARDCPPEQWDDPANWERQLAIDIRARAILYRRVMPGAALTPLALAKWWTDLPGLDHRGDRISPEEMLAQAHDLQERGQ